MTEAVQAVDAPEEARKTFGLTPKLAKKISQALDEGRRKRVRRLVRPLPYPEIADLIEQLSNEQRLRLLDYIREIFDPETLTELDRQVRSEVIAELGLDNVARAISDLDSDDAVELLGELDPIARDKILAAVPLRDRRLLEEGLSFPEDSAGRLMQREYVAVPSHWTVGNTIDYLREARDLPDEFYDIYVVDPAYRPLGQANLNQILRSRRPVAVTEVMRPEAFHVPAEMDQEEVAFLFRQNDLTSTAVTDDAGRLIGTVTIDDIVDVIHEEAEEDIRRMAGVADEGIYGAVIDTTKARFRWLLVNLATAVLASIVIGLFQATIQQAVALAVLMPIVASMGGNAGTQSLTVAVRALATRDLTATNALRVVWRETLVGLVCGLAFAVISAAVAWLWFGSPELGLIISAAMVITLVVATLTGTLVPIGLSKMDIDPAVASAVFLTTVTDIVGFFSFLGLAAWFLI
jgi:magnesium transporter